MQERRTRVESPTERILRRKLPRRPVVDRDDYIVNACAGKLVLHLGCTDAPLTEPRFRQGQLLHMKILDVAARATGVDIDAATIGWLKEQGVPDLHVGDAESLELILAEIDYMPQVIVAGEILEHLSRPLDFLLSIQGVMRGGAELIISVPNAFWFAGVLHVALGGEKVHPQHVAYYSYHTVAQLLSRALLEISDIAPCGYGTMAARLDLRGRVPHFVDATVRTLFPHLAPGYVLRARLVRPAD